MKKRNAVFFLLLFFIIASTLVFRYALTPRIKVFGTEYSPDDEGRIFLQLLSNVFTTIDNAQCYATIYNPDLTYFVDSQLMTNIGENGFYKYDFIAPNVTGVYMVSVRCSYPNNITTYYPTQSKYFLGSWINFQPYNLYYEDNSFSPYAKKFRIWFNQIGETPFIVKFINKINRNCDTDIYLYNHQTGTYDYFTTQDYYRPEISLTINDSAYVTPLIELRSSCNFRIELSNIQVYHVASEYQTNVRGGGEVHVSLKKTVISDIEIPDAKIIS